jgi:hypothetical protein
VKNMKWDSRIYLSTGDFNASFMVTVLTKLQCRSSHLLMQPQSRLRRFIHLHVPQLTPSCL